MTTLRKVSKDYEKAEVTCLFLYNRQSKSKTNLMTIFELVPSEQQSSKTIGDQKSGHMFRESIDDEYTLHITRLIDLDVNAVLHIYENVHSNFQLKHDNLDVRIEVLQTIASEPPDDNPLLIPLNSEKTLGRILPKRNSAMRVWSKLNTDKNWLSDFKEKFFEKLSSISRAYLGYDLTTIPEHIGNVYLCACNPILRGWNSSLLDGNKDLLISFYERNNKSIIGCHLVIEEERGKRSGFTLSRTIASNRERIPLPYFPDTLHKKLYDQNGNLIEHQLAVWRNIQFGMNIQESELKLRVKRKNGEEIFSIPKTTQTSTTTVGNFDFTNAHYLKDALETRKFEELERNKEFIFFANEADSKNRAQTTVRELLNKSKTRCMILDPYFGSGDLIYVITIQNISLPIQIISSVDYLERSIKKDDQKEPRTLKKLKSKTYAHQLQEGIKGFKKLYSQQTIECRVLKGSPSPLHDRYIVVDDDVYLLGSSLNEFGARATTIIKVPTPKRLIEQAIEWWTDNERCPTLSEYLSDKEM